MRYVLSRPNEAAFQQPSELAQKWFHTRVQADTQFSVLLSVAKPFPRLPFSLRRQSDDFLSHTLPSSISQRSIGTRRSQGRKRGPGGLVDPCHTTRETHKVSLGSQKHSCRCRALVLHKGHEGAEPSWRSGAAQKSVIV